MEKGGKVWKMLENTGKMGIFPICHLVVDGEGGCLHGHGQQVHGAVHQGRLKLPAQIHKFLLPGHGKIRIKFGINPGINSGSISKKNPFFFGLKSGLKWVCEGKKSEFLAQIHKFLLPWQGKIKIKFGISPGINSGINSLKIPLFFGLKSDVKWV